MDQKVKIVAVLASVAAVVLLIMVVVKSNQLGDTSKKLDAATAEVEKLTAMNLDLDSKLKAKESDWMAAQGESAKLKGQLSKLFTQLQIKQTELDKRTTVRPTTGGTSKTPTGGTAKTPTHAGTH